MSREIVKSIKLDKKNRRVILTSHCNNCIPRKDKKWECTGLSEIWQSKGLDSLIKEILFEFWQGNFSGSSTTYAKSLCFLDKKSMPLYCAFEYDDQELEVGFLDKQVNLAKEILMINYCRYMENRRSSFGKFILQSRSVISTKDKYYLKKCGNRIFLTESIEKAKIFKNSMDLKKFNNQFVIIDINNQSKKES